MIKVVNGHTSIDDDRLRRDARGAGLSRNAAVWRLRRLHSLMPWYDFLGEQIGINVTRYAAEALVFNNPAATALNRTCEKRLTISPRTPAKNRVLL